MDIIRKIKWTIQRGTLSNEGIWKLVNEICSDINEVCRFLNQ